VPSAWAMNDNSLLIFSTVLALFLLFTHRKNMRNLLAGTELRFDRIHIFSRKR